jgi:hypothetical protein
LIIYRKADFIALFFAVELVNLWQHSGNFLGLRACWIERESAMKTSDELR